VQLTLIPYFSSNDVVAKSRAVNTPGPSVQYLGFGGDSFVKKLKQTNGKKDNR
jgi:hypothetical protein